MNQYNKLFAFLDGKEYVLDGVHGTFEHTGTWPREQLYHNPSSRGKRTAKYQKIKRLLGDDHCTNLTASIDTYCQAARELGYED